MRASILLGVAVVLGLEGAAFCQTNAKSKEPEVMVFPDDKLLDMSFVPSGMMIGVKGLAIRTLLVRPRTHFVPEMLRSIENL